MSEPTTERLQPWLHDLVVALAAPTQIWCGLDGQVRASGAQGVYHGDVRALSRAELQVGGREPVAVQVEPEDGTSMLAVGIARHLGDRIPDPTVRVERRRRVSPGQVVEDVALVSAAHEAVRTDVRLLLAGDLAGMDEVKSGGVGSPVTPMVDDGTATWKGADGFTVTVRAPGSDLQTVEDHAEAVWQVDLPPGGTARLSWHCEVTDPAAVLVAPPMHVGDGQSWHPVVEASDGRLARWVDRSLGDLRALMLATAAAPDEAFLAAGAPWYLTLFGRDSLWAARMLLPLGTDLAASTLRLLASRQGSTVNADRAEQPGKILHELRRGELHLATDSARAEGGLHLPPVYYGTVDATPLWVCLLHDAWRWGLPDDEVEPLLPALEAALGWITEHGDSDGDGFLEYVDTTGRGLSNQGWKDSADSVRWRDGSLAEAPIALCEPQGYAHEAAVGGAALLEHFGRPGADRWTSWAEGLRERFRSRFWVEDADGGYPAIALDAAKRPVDSLTSNPGHLLGTGLLTEHQEALVARRMVSAEMDSGFGLRTLAESSGGFSPLSYHCGSVWPHDTAIVMSGLARCGHPDAAADLLDGLLAAAEAFDGRLPELFGGDSRDDVPAPVPYPAACRPQAWSAAAAVAALAAVAGLQPDVPGGTVRVAPLAPSPVGALRVAGLRVAGAPVTLSLAADGSLEWLHGTELEVR
jgi:glycogen debranching enzyme